LNNKTITIIFALLLLINIASAATFTITALEKPNALCPRESGLSRYIIKNTDTSARQYNVNLQGSAASWSTVVPVNFILNSFEEKDIYVYSTPASSVPAGSYNLELNAISGDEVQKLSNLVTVKNCFAVGLSPVQNKISLCPGDIAKYEVNIVNNGEYTETYQLSLEGPLKDRASLSDKTVILNKGESKLLTIYVNSPTDLADEYGLTLVAESSLGKIRNSVQLTLDVIPCYDFRFTSNGESNYSVCERTITTNQLKLENKGTTVNEYTLNLEGPMWARLNRQDIILYENEARYIDLVMAPDYGVEGDFDIKVSAVPKRGTLKSTVNLYMRVRKCNSVDLSIEQKEVQACKNSNNDFKVNVKNNGELKKVYRAELLNAPNWVTLNSVAQFELEPGKDKDLLIRAIPTDYIEKNKYSVKVKVTAADNSGVSAQDEEDLNIQVVDTENCYEPVLTTSYDDVIIYYDSSVAIPLSVKNNGLKRADYNLLLSGDATEFVRLNPNKLSLDPGQVETVYLYAAPGVNSEIGKYNSYVTLNLNDGPTLATKEFSFEVTSIKERATDVPPPSVDAENVDNVGLSNYFGTDDTKAFLSENKVPIIVGIVALLFLILVFVLGWHKSILNFFEEDLDEVEDLQKEIKEVETKKEIKEKKPRKKRVKNPVENVETKETTPEDEINDIKDNV